MDRLLKNEGFVAMFVDVPLVLQPADTFFELGHGLIGFADHFDQACQQQFRFAFINQWAAPPLHRVAPEACYSGSGPSRQ